MSYSISGRSAIARPRSSGPGAPSASPDGSIIGKSAIARPCPDGPGAPSGDKSGYSVTGSALWRSPCDEIDLCGITDSFTRTIPPTSPPATPSLGVSDVCITWVEGYWHDIFREASSVAVDGTKAVFDFASGDYANFLLPIAASYPLHVLVKASAVNSVRGMFSLFFRDNAAGQYENVLVNLATSDETIAYGSGYNGPVYTGQMYITAPDGGYGHSTTPATVLSGPFTLDKSFWIRCEIEAAGTKAKAWWDGDTEPSGWQVEDSTPTGGIPNRAGTFIYAEGGSASYTLDSLDIADVNRCTCGITDTFNRADQVGLGTADCGTAWIVSNDNDCSKIADNAAWVGQYSGGDSTNRTLTASLAVDLPLPLHIEVDMDPTCDNGTYLEWTANPGNDAVSVHLLPDPYGTLEIMLPGSSGDDAAIALAKGTLYHVVVEFDGTVLTATIGSTTVTAATSTPFTSVESLHVTASTGSAEHDLAHFDNLAICGVNLCTAP